MIVDPRREEAGGDGPGGSLVRRALGAALGLPSWIGGGDDAAGAGETAGAPFSCAVGVEATLDDDGGGGGGVQASYGSSAEPAGGNGRGEEASGEDGAGWAPGEQPAGLGGLRAAASGLALPASGEEGALPGRLGAVDADAERLALPPSDEEDGAGAGSAASGKSSRKASPRGGKGAKAAKPGKAGKGGAGAGAGGAGGGGWRTLRGEERVPSRQEWQAAVAEASLRPSPASGASSALSAPRPAEGAHAGASLVASLPGPALSHIDPDGLVGLGAPRCRLALLSDRWATSASLERELKEASALSPAARALLAPYETAALLSMAGVGTVVANQLPVTRAGGVECLLDLLHGCFGPGAASPAEVLARRRARVVRVPAAGPPADALALGEGGDGGVAMVPAGLKVRAAVAPVVWGLGFVRVES